MALLEVLDIYRYNSRYTSYYKYASREYHVFYMKMELSIKTMSMGQGFCNFCNVFITHIFNYFIRFTFNFLVIIY